MRATDKRLLTAYLAGSGGGSHGPIVLHGAYTQLWLNLTAQGQEVFITNLGTYTVLRAEDME